MKFPPVSDIRKTRKSLDVTQAELSRASGVSQSTIAKIECGRISASYEIVVRLFETLDAMRVDGGSLNVSMIASSNVVSIPSTELVHRASEIMMAEGHSQLPVIDDGVPVGSITERMIFDLMREGFTMEELSRTPISEIMAQPFPVVPDGTPMTAVANLMVDNDAVLVSRKGAIVGVVTDADMLKLVRGPSTSGRRGSAGTSPCPRRRRTLGTPCAPRPPGASGPRTCGSRA